MVFVLNISTLIKATVPSPFKTLTFDHLFPTKKAFQSTKPKIVRGMLKYL